MKVNWTTLLTLFLFQVHAQDKPLVIATASMIMDIARNIGGDMFMYDVIVPIGGDPHIYEPTPGDAQLCNRANLILKNGLTFEGWITKLIDNSGSKAVVATVTEGIEPISSALHTSATDPHAWMEAANGIVYAKNITDAMTQLLPKHADTFHQSFLRYKTKLEKLDQYIIERIKSIPETKRILITSHDSFHYYGKRYGLRLESILGTSTDADVQTADIRRLTEIIRTSGVPAVFVESTINPKMLEQIAHDNNIAIGGKLFSDSLSDENGPASTYIDMIRHNTDTIYKGLTMKDEDVSQDSERSGGRTWLWLLLLAPVVLGVIIFIFRMIRKSQ